MRTGREPFLAATHGEFTYLFIRFRGYQPATEAQFLPTVFLHRHFGVVEFQPQERVGASCCATSCKPF
jgi:hypothetical protein